MEGTEDLSLHGRKRLGNFSEGGQALVPEEIVDSKFSRGASEHLDSVSDNTLTQKDAEIVPSGKMPSRGNRANYPTKSESIYH